MEILTFELGPMDNNTILLADADTGGAVVIDPTFDVQPVLDALAEHRWELKAIWLTHAHFDHMAGIFQLVKSTGNHLPVGLHSFDLDLYNDRGNAEMFGLDLPPFPAPEILFNHGDILAVGKGEVEVRLSPGHTPGHVMFYIKENKTLISGDVLFQGSIGRTDFPGGDFHQLIESIRNQALTLPDDTIVYTGHGPETTIGQEKRYNPFF